MEITAMSQEFESQRAKLAEKEKEITAMSQEFESQRAKLA
jgi:hypothetical protein